MATKKVSQIPDDKLTAYDKLLESLNNVERKGASMPYTSLNGHMFSFLSQDGSLALRLPKESRETFIEKHRTSLCEAHGTVIKEYVVVPDKVFKDVPVMLKYFLESYEYVRSLKPKITAKKASANAVKSFGRGPSATAVET